MRRLRKKPKYEGEQLDVYRVREIGQPALSTDIFLVIMDGYQFRFSGRALQVLRDRGFELNMLTKWVNTTQEES